MYLGFLVKFFNIITTSSLSVFILFIVSCALDPSALSSSIKFMHQKSFEDQSFLFTKLKVATQYFLLKVDMFTRLRYNRKHSKQAKRENMTRHYISLRQYLPLLSYPPRGILLKNQNSLSRAQENNFFSNLWTFAACTDRWQVWCIENANEKLPSDCWIVEQIRDAIIRITQAL